jgi:hypothetical protein
MHNALSDAIIEQMLQLREKLRRGTGELSLVRNSFESFPFLDMANTGDEPEAISTE